MKIDGPEGRIWVEDVPEQLGMPAELTISVFGSPALIEGVKELLQRGANLWPDAMPEVKGLADLATNGRLMQEYQGVKATGVTHVDSIQLGDSREPQVSSDQQQSGQL